MTITVELYDDTGAVLSGHGTNRATVTNIGWKKSALDETNAFVFYPIQRQPTTCVWSYTKYNYMKISGTYAAGGRPRIEISGSAISAPPSGHEGTDKVRVYYKLTNVYATSSNAFDGSLIYLPPGVTHVLYPMLSATGPEAATSYLKHMTTNGTYFTQYLVTQLFVEPGQLTDYGNIGEITVKVFLDEYETADI